ncbi:MAG: hypothetical protein KGL39_52770 [Patescibacteria group bacterium]|nr:hypothetical protein [Patescibacteria group bacterium]
MKMERKNDNQTANAIGVGSGDVFSLPREQLNILRHAVGVDSDGTDRYPNALTLDERRNRFVTDPASEDGKNCQALVAQGWLADQGAQKMLGGMHYYTVTEDGMNVVRLHRPQPKRNSRSARRYQDFLNADCGLRFGEWLKRQGRLNTVLGHALGKTQNPNEADAKT